MTPNGKYYSSFSGADISATVGTEQFATLQAISYSVTREKGPVYTMGSADPRAFARGKRAIAGSIIFVMIDKSSLLSHFQQEGKDQFYGNKMDTRFNYPLDATQTAMDNLFSLTSAFTVANVAADGAGSEKVATSAYYVDQVLPFDIHLSAANEMGQIAKKSFVGVELLNEGGGVSIDDLVMEEQYTYICRFMTPWIKVASAPSLGQSNYMNQ